MSALAIFLSGAFVGSSVKWICDEWQLRSQNAQVANTDDDLLAHDKLSDNPPVAPTNS
ncbi:MAG: hypothetical protein ACPG8W_00150 [Candidatus Promineifilaceae bacterium]